MSTISTLCSALILVCYLNVGAQSLGEHVWKDRVLLLVTNDLENNHYQEQFDILRTDPEGLKDRKLVIYSLTPNSYARGLHALKWSGGKELFKKYKTSSVPFEIILIGLDGGVKLRQGSVIELNGLFARIDAMPMRANELRQRQH